MNNIEYDLGDILDKKDFSTHLTNSLKNLYLNFEKDSKIFSFYLDKIEPSKEQSSESIIKILNENHKGVITITDNYFHFFSDFVGPIYVFLKGCIQNNIKKVEIVGLDFATKPNLLEKLVPFLYYCLEMFSDKIEVVYTQIKETKEKQFFQINNSIIIDQQNIGISMDFIYDAAVKFSNSLHNNTPSKKVFISRKNDVFKDNSENRNINQDEIEDFFKSIGFEIVNGEGFSSLKEQINFFNQVSVFAGLTGSGMTSSMFMQPGQTIIEVVCPITFGDRDKYEIHNFYKTISMLKKHKYVAISNINNNKEDLIKQLEDLAKML